MTAIVVVASIRPAGWSVTSLPRVGAHTPLAADARRVDSSFRLVRTPGYDGQFYWAIAVDPLATGSTHRDVDKPSYRYGHPLLGWIGWIFSGGQAGAAAVALLVAGFLSIAAAAALAARLGGLTASLFVSCNPGLLYAAAHTLSEPLAVALLLGAIVGDRARRVGRAAALCAFVPLTKEALVLVPLALAAFSLRRRDRRGALLYAASILPSVVWWAAMRIHLGAWFTTGDSALGAPFKGWRRAILDAGVQAAAGQRGEAILVVLVAILGVLACVAVVALRLREPIDLVYVLLAIVTACLAENATLIFRDALRNVAILAALAPFVLRARGSERASG